VSTTLVEQIATKAAMLSPERQREALALIEQLAARAAAKPYVPRAERQLKGATAQGQSISSEEINEARREMWSEYMREDEG